VPEERGRFVLKVLRGVKFPKRLEETARTGCQTFNGRKRAGGRGRPGKEAIFPQAKMAFPQS